MDEVSLKIMIATGILAIFTLLCKLTSFPQFSFHLSLSCCSNPRFLSLGCMVKVLLRQVRHEPPVSEIDEGSPNIIQQHTINNSFPVRVYPSRQQLYIDSNDDLVVRHVHVQLPSKEEEEGVAEESTMTTITQESTPRTACTKLFVDFGRMSRFWNRNQTTAQCNVAPPPMTELSSSMAITPQSPSVPSPSVSIPIEPTTEPDYTLPIPEPVKSYAASVFEEHCSICLSEYSDGDHVRLLPCGHEYHTECVGRFFFFGELWLQFARGILQLHELTLFIFIFAFRCRSLVDNKVKKVPALQARSVTSYQRLGRDTAKPISVRILVYSTAK